MCCASPFRPTSIFHWSTLFTSKQLLHHVGYCSLVRYQQDTQLSSYSKLSNVLCTAYTISNTLVGQQDGSHIWFSAIVRSTSKLCSISAKLWTAKLCAIPTKLRTTTNVPSHFIYGTPTTRVPSTSAHDAHTSFSKLPTTTTHDDASPTHDDAATHANATYATHDDATPICTTTHDDATTHANGSPPTSASTTITSSSCQH